MGSTTHRIDGAARRTRRQSIEIGDEFREKRLSLATSQATVAAAARLSRTRYGLIERGQSTQLTLTEINRVAAVLGLIPSIRIYPDGVPIRDVAHATRLQRFLAAVRSPLAYRLEVPLPLVEGRPERRAWDAVVFRHEARCVVELEMRLRDVQALRRRIELKRRDDPSESFLLLIADTRHNRRVVAEFETSLVDLPRLRPTRVQSNLAAGQLPPTGLVFV